MPPKFRSFDKAESNSQFRWKYIRKPNKNAGFTHLQIERNPWLAGYRPQIPVFFQNVLNWICWALPRTKFLDTPLVHAIVLCCSNMQQGSTASNQHLLASRCKVVNLTHFRILTFITLKVYNDQRNVQVFNLFIYLLPPHVFRVFF
jgi:hypothetical protein